MCGQVLFTLPTFSTQFASRVISSHFLSLRHLQPHTSQQSARLCKRAPTANMLCMHFLLHFRNAAAAPVCVPRAAEVIHKKCMSCARLVAERERASDTFLAGRKWQSYCFLWRRKSSARPAQEFTNP